MVRVDVRDGHVRRNRLRCIRPNGRRVGDGDARRVRNPNDRRVELPHGHNQDHEHEDVRASQRNYATRLVIATERCLAIRV